MRQLSTATINKIKDREDDLVTEAKGLVEELNENKERQLRNIQGIAENTSSWEVVKLFMKYQAARNQIDMAWTNKAVDKLEGLANDAKSIATSKDNIKDLHLELVSRVLGYAVRWHVWNNAVTKRKEKSA